MIKTSLSNRKRLPEHVCRPGRRGEVLHDIKLLLRRFKLHSVCEEARCPNIGLCFSRRTAAFLIMGSVCTRNCRFCDVAHGKAQPLDPEEPEHLAAAVEELGLKHVVVTSVSRDDLPDGGAAHFAACIRALHRRFPQAAVEVLVPDFAGVPESIAIVAAANPKVFNHNLETVSRLYDSVRPQANYKRSLNVLRAAREMNPDMLIKSGVMAGLGETHDEMTELMQDLLRAGCGILTIGQYLQPRKSCLDVVRYLEPEEFEAYKRQALEMGFKRVAAEPLARSSFMADSLAAP